MKETHFFFPSGEFNLYGFLHEPEGPGNRAGYVFCAPFAEEKLWTHRVFVNFARDLSNLGYTIIRFDYMGNGDSDGEFEKATVETMLQDIESAIKVLREKAPSVKSVGLLGMRFGATLAALAAEKNGGIDNLILWEPVLKGTKYMQETLMTNIAMQTAMYKKVIHNRKVLVDMMEKGETVNIDGYEMCHDFYKQASAIDLLTEGKSVFEKCLVVQFAKAQQDFRPEFQKLKSLYANSDLMLATEGQFWKDIKLYYTNAKNLFDGTLKWLGSGKNVKTGG